MSDVKQTIKLDAATVQLFNKTVDQLRASQEQFQELQKQVQAKQEESKAINSRLEGILLGAMAAKGVDPANFNVQLKEDFTEILLFEKTPVPSANGVSIDPNQEIIAEALPSTD